MSASSGRNGFERFPSLGQVLDLGLERDEAAFGRCRSRAISKEGRIGKIGIDVLAFALDRIDSVGQCGELRRLLEAEPLLLRRV